MQYPGTAVQGASRSGAAMRWLCLGALGLSVPFSSLAAADVAEEKTEPKLAAAVEPKPAQASPSLPPARLAARLRLQYDYRAQGDEEDSDLYGYLYVEGRDLNAGRMDVYSSARLHSDLDKKSSSASLEEDPFHSLDDSDGVTENRLMQLYVDLHDRARRLALRGGRQYVDISDYLHLDGAQLMFNEAGDLGGRVYAGQPVSYYSSLSGDLAGGLSLVGRPWEGNRSRLTIARYYDEEEDEADHNYFVDVRQEISDSSRTRGQMSLLNDEFRMGRLDWFVYTPDGETDFSVGGSYWGSFDAKTRAYSPLYDVLGEQDPYTYAYTRLTQQLVPGWFLSPGVSIRLADEGSNENNNRDYENYDLTLIYQPTRAFSASVAAEYWAVDPSDSFVGVSGELRYRQGRVWEVSGGISFADYSYDTYSDISYAASGGQAVLSETGTVYEESPYVQTYFLRGKWRVTKRLILRLQGDIEDDDSSDDLAYRGRGSMEIRY